MKSPPQAAVDAAIACPLIRYHRLITGNAYTNGAFFGGASITLAVASHAGNIAADARLLQQIRYTLTPGNEICANGGYPAQHERHVTGMFAIVKRTPRIWDQLTPTEKTKIDLLMKAALVASAFITSDTNPFYSTGSQQYTLDGDSNVNREWGPNYREGMIGGMLVGMVYFGGPAAAHAVLDTYDHSQFVAALNANSLPNTFEIFNWKAANPSSPAPTGTMIRNAVKNHRYKTWSLADHSSIYWSLVDNTYGRYIHAGLNNGAGVELAGGGYAGKIASGAATLPNPGAYGMLKEFDTVDANGLRSSLVYSYDGYRPHQTNQIVLILGGYWQKGGAVANAALARIRIGNTDLKYKIEKGYIGYAKGASQGALGTTFYTQRGYYYVWPLWEDVLKPYHDDTDSDGLDDANEIRLGLDPASSSSRFAATLSGRTLRWPSAAGLGFTVERKTAEAGATWRTIATINGTAGTASFTDASPPAGSAFYRVGLKP